jgi:hypothetical protein
MRLTALSSAALAATLVVPGLARAESPADKGLRLAREADVANAGWKSERATLTMELINAHGEKTSRKMVIETLEGTSDGDRSKVTFQWPADVKGTKLLTWSHKTGDDDQWLYLPAVKRVKRISSNNKSGSFMGSEFSYEDLGSQEVEKYSYRWLADKKEQGRTCDQIERVPSDKKSGYKRQVLCLDRETRQPLRIDYYDRKNELLKTAVLSDFKKEGKLWRVGRIDMTNVQTKKRSILVWTERKLGAKLDATGFESASLED